MSERDAASAGWLEAEILESRLALVPQSHTRGIVLIVGIADWLPPPASAATRASSLRPDSDSDRNGHYPLPRRSRDFSPN